MNAEVGGLYVFRAGMQAFHAVAPGMGADYRGGKESIMFRPAMIGDILRLTGEIMLAGIVCYGLLVLAAGTLDFAAPYLGTARGRVPDLAAPLSRDQLAALLVTWALFAIGLGIWPFAQKIGRVIAEGIVFIIGLLAGVQLHQVVDALARDADTARVFTSHGLTLAVLALISAFALWLPEACAGLRLPRAVRLVALVLVLAAAIMGLR